MRTTLLILIALLFLTSVSFAQNDIAERLEAKKVNKYVLFSLNLDNPKKLNYEVDSRDGNSSAKLLKDLLTVVGDGGETFNVLFEYLNPMKYSVTISETATDDSIYESATQFIESVTSFANLLQGIQEATSLASNEAAKTAEKAKAPKKEPKVAFYTDEDYKALYAPDLLEWFLFYSIEDNAKCIDNATDFLKALNETDNHLYGAKTEAKGVPVTEKRESTLFYEDVGSIVHGLLTPSTMDELKAGQSQLQTTQDRLKDRNKKAIEALGKVKPALQALVWKSGPSDAEKALMKLLEDLAKSGSEDAKKALGELQNVSKSGSDCKTFEIYTDAAVTRFINSANIILARRKKLISDIDSLLTEVKKVIDRDAEKDSYLVGQVEVVPNKIKEVTITVKQRELKFDEEKLEILVTEKEGALGKIRVREHSALIPEFTGGVLYTNLSFPKFGTEDVDGKTVVAEAKEEERQVAISGMLNLIFDLPVRSLVYPLLQLGVSTSEERPSLFAGLGLRFIRPVPFSLSGGAIWKWTRELDKLKVGDAINGTAALEDDLTINFNRKPTFYLGIQTSF